MNTKLLISIIDILLIFIILFLLNILAVKYDANKGLSEKTYKKIPFVSLSSDHSSTIHNYTVIRIDKNNIVLLKFKNNTYLNETFIDSVKDFKNNYFINDLKYVIDEDNKSDIVFNEVIRFLVEKNANFMIMRKDE